jgi:hypothetical protein
MNGLTTELMEYHTRYSVLEPSSDTERQRGGEELIDIIGTYLK